MPATKRRKRKPDPRINLRLTREADGALTHTAQLAKTNKTDTACISITVANAVAAANDQGYRVFVTDQHGNHIQEILYPLPAKSVVMPVVPQQPNEAVNGEPPVQPVTPSSEEEKPHIASTAQ